MDIHKSLEQFFDKYYIENADLAYKDLETLMVDLIRDTIKKCGS